MKEKKKVKNIRIFPAVLGRTTVPTDKLMDFICAHEYGEGWKYDKMDGKHCYKFEEVDKTE